MMRIKRTTIVSNRMLCIGTFIHKQIMKNTPINFISFFLINTSNMV